MQKPVEVPTESGDTGLQEMLAEFLALFPYRGESLVKSASAGGWRLVSRFHDLSDDEITSAIETESKLKRAVSFDKKTRFLVLGIPAASPYHTPPVLSLIREAFSELSINTRAYQLDDDWYIYIFFDSWADAAACSKILTDWCACNGLTVDDRHLRIYPQRPGLPMPLQPSFAWLNDRAQLLLRRDEVSLLSGLALFAKDMQTAAVPPAFFVEAFTKSLTSARLDSAVDSFFEEAIAQPQSMEVEPTQKHSDEPSPAVPHARSEAEATAVNQVGSVPTDERFVGTESPTIGSPTLISPMEFDSRLIDEPRGREKDLKQAVQLALPIFDGRLIDIVGDRDVEPIKPRPTRAPPLTFT